MAQKVSQDPTQVRHGAGRKQAALQRGVQVVRHGPEATGGIGVCHSPIACTFTHTYADAFPSGLLDLCLDLNQNPHLPPDLRFDISHDLHPPDHSLVAADITPEEADKLISEYESAVKSAQIPTLDLHVVRQQVNERLAAKGAEALHSLESSVSHPVAGDFPDDIKGNYPHNFLDPDQESDYLKTLDAKLADSLAQADSEQDEKDKHWAGWTAREFERHMELHNPQSQHSWLKEHAAEHAKGGLDEDYFYPPINELPAKPASAKKRAEKGKTLAKQVGDRAVERMTREGWSPSAASGMDEDELGRDEGLGGKKKGRGDADGTFRLKGGKGGSTKGKRKRSGEEGGRDGTPSGGGKKAKVEVE